MLYQVNVFTQNVHFFILQDSPDIIILRYIMGVIIIIIAPAIQTKALNGFLQYFLVNSGTLPSSRLPSLPCTFLL